MSGWLDLTHTVPVSSRNYLGLFILQIRLAKVCWLLKNPRDRLCSLVTGKSLVTAFRNSLIQDSKQSPQVLCFSSLPLGASFLSKLISFQTQKKRNILFQQFHKCPEPHSPGPEMSHMPVPETATLARVWNSVDQLWFLTWATLCVESGLGRFLLSS